MKVHRKDANASDFSGLVRPREPRTLGVINEIASRSVTALLPKRLPPSCLGFWVSVQGLGFRV